MCNCTSEDAPPGAGPESILPVVVMDSGLARSLSSGRALRGPVGAPRNDGGNFYQPGWVERSDTHQLLLVSQKSSTHTNYMRSSADVKNLVPSKKRFGRLNTEMNVAPLGACATWTLPPGRHTKSPAPQLPSESSSDPSSMWVCSSAVCSCNGTTAPGAILNRMVERPSSSRYRIFISMPSNSVRCQGIDDAATKVERSSGGLTGTGLFMASPPMGSGYFVDRDLVRDAAQRHASGRRLQPLGLQQGPGLRVLHHLFRH